MSEVLASKDALLSGEEIRFLRKSAGFKAGTFAEHIGISPEHLSRVENGKTDKLGEAADKLARAICLAQIDAQNSDAIRELLLKRAAHLKAMRTRRLKRQFSLARGVWTEAA
jgi:transcriptional regulator with XRE-family HTH domain